MRWLFALISAVLLTAILSGIFWYRTTSSECLTILSYATMASDFGAGPELLKAFEDETGCRAKIEKAGGPVGLVQYFEMLPRDRRPDLIMGLDQFEFMESSNRNLWRPLSSVVSQYLPQSTPGGAIYGDPARGIPFDWAPLTIIYRTGEQEPPRSIKEFRDPKMLKSLSLADPISSPTGYAFLWMLTESLGENWRSGMADYLPAIHSVSPSWSTSYGIFQKKLVPFTFSYATSAVYHWKEERDRRYQPLVLDEGHPYQVEIAVIPQESVRVVNAEKFMRFLLSDRAQRLLMEKNFMLPVKGEVRAGSLFAELPQFPLFSEESQKRFFEQRVDLMKTFADLRAQ